MRETKEQIAAAIAALEARREMVADMPTELAIAALRERLVAGEPGGSDEREPAGVEPRRRQVTVLFVDVVGSTAIGRQLDPEDIGWVVDGALRRLTAIVGAHGGTVLQYAGDSLLAVFGAVKGGEGDAENALLAGLEIIEEANRLALQLAQSHGIGHFAVRVGAHTGPVMLGSGVNGEQSIRGNAVNIAARMEQTALAGTLRISQDCYRHVRDLFEVDEQPPLLVKGMEQPLQTYLVRRSLRPARRAARRGVQGLPTRFVDRLDEMRLIREAYLSLCTGEPSLAALILVADAGIGKSRLIAEFGAWARQQPAGVQLLTAHANERRMGQPYGLLHELLTSTLPILDSDPPEQARLAWLAATAPLLASEADAALLGHLLGLDFSAHEAVRGILGDAQQIRDRGYHYACELLRRLALAGPPMLLLIDQPQVGVTASHRTPQTRASAGDWGS